MAETKAAKIDAKKSALVLLEECLKLDPNHQCKGLHGKLAIPQEKPAGFDEPSSGSNAEQLSSEKNTADSIKELL